MLEIDYSRCRLAPYAHQRRGIKTLVLNRRYGLFWQMRLGKTKAVIDAACFLHSAGMLDRVLLCVPAQVKPVWLHKDIGEIKKHAFVEAVPLEFDSSSADYLDILAQSCTGLPFIVVSHELLRQEDAKGGFPRCEELSRSSQGRTWLVFDEASAFGNHKSLQTKSALHLRNTIKPERLTTMDGTPIGNSPIEQYSKFKLLGEDVLGYRNFFHFRAVHQVAEPSIYAKNKKAYVGFQRQELIDRRVRPFCEYLEQKDCLDMPEKVRQTHVVRMKPKTWRIYREMRDELVAQLDSGEVSAQHAHVKGLRLAQICSGFVGGVDDEVTGEKRTAEVGEETLEWAVQWTKARLAEYKGQFRCVLWCRWRPELERLYRSLTALSAEIGLTYGQRSTYQNQLHPDSPQPKSSYILCAQPQALRYGVNLSRADTEVFMSQDYNRITQSQAEERIQDANVGRKISLLLDVLVEGPEGQKTIAWDIAASLQSKEEVARRTTGEWKKILTEE